MNATMIVTFGLLAGALALIAWMLVTSYQQAVSGSGNMKLLRRMFARQGASAEPQGGDAEWMAMADAARRCTYCSAAHECEAFLDEGRKDGIEAFCPNAGLIAARRERV